MAERQLRVTIIGDDKDLQRAFASSGRKARAFDAQLTGIGRGLSAGFAAAGVALGATALFAVTKRAVQAASDLNEEISKSEQVFGASSKEIQAWAETTARSMGVARNEALQATGTFGNLFRVVEIAPAAAAEMSQALVGLAADLASFNNADPTDVLTAIRSGLIGEAEPLRRYGVLLSETRVAQAAMAATGKENVKELTNQEKALARYNIILSDTAPAQGDFARTSGGLANQSRILRAQLGDLSAELGGNLIPALIVATKAANGLFDAFEALGQGGNIEIDVDQQDLASLDALREKIVGLTGDTGFLIAALDEAISKIRDAQPLRPDDRAGPRGAGAVSASNLKAEEQERQREQAATKRRLEASQKKFATFIKGLGLKLDKAGLTSSLDNDIAVLREIERAILRQIGREGKTFELVQQLTDTRLRIADLIARNVSEANRKTKKATDKTKRATTTGKSDQARRIEEQFEALGLTSDGGARTPGVGALQRRLGDIRKQVKGTALDTGKTGSQLDRIAKVLRGKFGKVGKDVRSAILGMFNDISSALSGGSEGKAGPMTGFVKRGAEDILAGMGLSEQEVKELRQRLAQIGPGGTAPGKGFGAFGQSFPPGGAGVRGSDNIVIENRVFLDGKEITIAVTKKQQKKRSQGSPSRRGTRAGR